MCDGKPRTYIIYPGVQIGPGAQIGEWVIIGVPPRGIEPGEMETSVGAGLIIRSHSVLYAGNIIGGNFETGHGVMIRESNQIGDNVSVGTHSIVEHHVQIGNNVRIHSNAFIPEYSVARGRYLDWAKCCVHECPVPAESGSQSKSQGAPHFARGQNRSQRDPFARCHSRLQCACGSRIRCGVRRSGRQGGRGKSCQNNS